MHPSDLAMSCPSNQKVSRTRLPNVHGNVVYTPVLVFGQYNLVTIVKLGRAIFEICELTDRHTDIQTR